MIIGEHVQIRAVEYEDLPTLAAWRNDPRVYRYFYEHEPLSAIMQRSWFDRVLARPDERFWIVETVDTKSPIGTIGLSHIDWRNRRTELSRVLIIEEYRGRGWGTEAICLVLCYCFEHLNMNRLCLDTLAENQRAVDLYKRVGFKQEGTLRQHVFKDGRYCDLVYLAMLREEYLSPKTQAVISEYAHTPSG